MICYDHLEGIPTAAVLIKFWKVLLTFWWTYHCHLSDVTLFSTRTARSMGLLFLEKILLHARVAVSTIRSAPN